MNSFSTTSWGYKILSENKINFYHILLPKIDLQLLSRKIPSIQYIKQQKDGSITISVSNSLPILSTIDTLVDFFTRKEQNFLDTPDFKFIIDPDTRLLLSGWSLAFQGCLGLLITHHPKIAPLIENNWSYINSSTGGLHIAPYTMLLYEDRVKIIHPVTVGNYQERKQIEQITAGIIRKIIRHIQEAQPTLEGLALISLVEETTGISQKQISTIINEKSFGVKTPLHSPFFTY